MKYSFLDDANERTTELTSVQVHKTSSGQRNREVDHPCTAVNGVQDIENKLMDKNPTDDMKFQCHVCEEHFVGSSDLRKHNRLHTSIKPHKCKVCDKAFSRAYHLKTHT